jgi:hypothetical protein
MGEREKGRKGEGGEGEKGRRGEGSGLESRRIEN